MQIRIVVPGLSQHWLLLFASACLGWFKVRGSRICVVQGFVLPCDCNVVRVLVMPKFLESVPSWQQPADGRLLSRQEREAFLVAWLWVQIASKELAHGEEAAERQAAIVKSWKMELAAKVKRAEELHVASQQSESEAQARLQEADARIAQVRSKRSLQTFLSLPA